MVLSIQTFAQYLVEAPFWFNTAMSLFGKDSTSFSHLDLGILCHSSLQILSKTCLYLKDGFPSWSHLG